MNLFMQNFDFFMPLNFVIKTVLLFGGQVLGGSDAGYRLGYKRASNVKMKLEMESVGPKLSKSGFRMFLRCFVRNLCSEVVR